MASPDAAQIAPAAAVPPAKGAGKKGAPPPKGLGKGGPGKAPPSLPRETCERLKANQGPKLRPLFWTGVSQVSPESVWANLEPAAPFDSSVLERQFCLGDSRTPSSTKNGSAPGSRSASEEPRKRVRVLDDRTSQLLAIAFNRLPPPERLAGMVDAFENFPDGLTAEAVLALHGAINEHKDAVEQIRLVANTTPEAIAQMDMPERLLLRVSEVPFCTAKLACGALIVGSAKDLKDLRINGQKVGVCCQDIRKSKLLRKFVSTALAVGNFLNRGTARSSLRGVVLPESLLKLEELRGNSPAHPDASADSGDNVAFSVLDFVVQALVDEAGSGLLKERALEVEGELLKEAENLLLKARSAASVSLEETEANCRQINTEATKAKQGLSEIPASPGAIAVTERVDRICKEATLAVEISQKAKEQLAKAQKWSCCKEGVKSCDWFANWVHFLELLPRAFARAREAKARRLVQEEEQRRREREIQARRPPLAAVNATALPTYSKGKANVGAQFDDEARIDNIDLSKLHHPALFPAPYGEADTLAPNFTCGKENTVN